MHILFVQCDVPQPVDTSNTTGWINCADCNRNFPTERCFSEHLRTRTCEKIWWCLECKKIIRVLRKNHECDPEGAEREKGSKGRKCHRCHQSILGKPQHHVCYIQPQVLSEKAMTEEAHRRFIYFDFETTQYLGPHVVNLAVSYGCDMEAPVVHNTLNDFCQWLFGTEDNKERVAIAHNGKGYDFQFIRSWCTRNHREIDVISNGLKIMKMVDLTSGIVFLDSLNFLPMPLAAFTKTFGLGESVDGHVLKKGYFPHFANTPLNVATWIGDVPAKKYFGPSNFRTEVDLMRFEKWHAERQAEVDSGLKPYDFKQELVDYCVSDVYLLKAGCEVFRDLYLQHTGVDPFGCVTIASTCMSIYRRNFLESDQLVRDVPELRSGNYSKMRMEWTLWRASMSSVDVELPCADDIDSVGYGYTGGVRTHVFHFMNDFEHGNLNVFEAKMYNRRKRTQMGVVSRRREQQHLKWEAEGLVVSKMWQSAWITERKGEEFTNWREDPQVNAVFPPNPLDPREAFFGGRTNACKLKYEFNEEEGEYGMYVDICSLYPTVNYNDPYPVGVPSIWRYDEGRWLHKDKDAHVFFDVLVAPKPEEVFGFIQCTVECPKDLYHPVLPTKHPGGKLTFDLVSPKRGTWATPEILLALRKGYVIKEVHEMWHYESSGDLFKEYVKTFLKIKQESSGWPEGTKGDEEKEAAYMAEFEAKMGFELDKEKIEKNPGLRTLAKLCLNSLWGKFGERVNQLQTKVVYSHKQLLEILEDERFEVKRVTSLTPSATEVAWVMKEEFMATDGRVGNVNLPIAAFTTSHARTRLYAGLELLGEQVLYYDTDSIIYRYNPHILTDTHMPTGTNLGEWTLEAHKLVDVFLSTGPKSYSYTEESVGGERKMVTKVKGFTLNLRNSEQINQESMRRVVDGRGSVKIATLNPKRIRLEKSGGIPVKSVAERKLFGFTYTKRFIMELSSNGRVLDTLPWGHEYAFGYMNDVEDLSTVEEANVQDELDHPDQGKYELDMNAETAVGEYDDLTMEEAVATEALIDENDVEHRSMLRDYVLIR